MLYQAVIFDLDGTLTDSKEGILKSTAYALQKVGCPVPPEHILRKFLGPPLAESMIRYCGMTEAEATRATEIYRERYVPIGAFENRVYPGIRALLRALKKRGVYLAVATGKPTGISTEILRRFGLLDYFDKVQGPDLTCFHCDKADMIHAVLPEGMKALMIGDSVSDVTAGQECGLDTAAALYGYGDADALQALHPTYLAHTPNELQTIILGEEIKDQGFFISVEGLDGCGKTTQMPVIEETLKGLGLNVRKTREPGGCPVSESIRAILLSEKENGLTDIAEALLFAASRAQHVHDVILPAVARGEVVVSDRFVDSSIAYQGGGRQLGVDRVMKINEPAVEHCMPDLTVYLAIDAQISIARRRASSVPDRIEQQGDDFFMRIEQGYNELLARDAKRFLMIDGRGTADEVSERIRQALPAALKERGLI